MHFSHQEGRTGICAAEIRKTLAATRPPFIEEAAPQGAASSLLTSRFPGLGTVGEPAHEGCEPDRCEHDKQ